MKKFSGAYTAMVTPFNDKGKINFDLLEKTLEFQIESGINGLVPCGTTGESATMSNSEKMDVIKFVIEKANGRVPVMAGTGGNNTAVSIELTKWAAEEGADSALLVTPYYNKPGQEGLFLHYEAIAKNAPELPMVIYNVPGRTNINIAEETVEKLFSKYPNLCCTKDASADMHKIIKLRAICGDDFSILSGEDGMVLPYLAAGADGVVSVMSNIFPEETANMVAAWQGGQVSEAMAIQSKLRVVIDLLFGKTNPIPVKAGMSAIGFDMGVPRLPLHDLCDEEKTILFSEIEKLKINK